MFFTKSIEQLEHSAAEAKSALDTAIAALSNAESADTNEGSASTWKALEQARQNHDRAARRHATAQSKLADERARLERENLQLKHERLASLRATITDPAGFVADECAELVELDAKLHAILDRFESKHLAYIAARNEWVRLSRELGCYDRNVDGSSLNFSTQGYASRALTAARVARREKAFAAGKGRPMVHNPEFWLIGAPENFPLAV